LKIIQSALCGCLNEDRGIDHLEIMAKRIPAVSI